jgi:hypothetical protein
VRGRFVFVLYSKKKFKKTSLPLNTAAALTSNLHMKKLLLLSAVLLGTVGASQAGVRFNLGFGIPLPPPVVVAPAAPVYIQPAPPVCVAPPVYAPAPVVVTPPVFSYGYGHFRAPYHWHGPYHYRR